MTFEFDGVLGLGLASLAVDPEFSRGPRGPRGERSGRRVTAFWTKTPPTSGGRGRIPMFGKQKAENEAPGGVRAILRFAHLDWGPFGFPCQASLARCPRCDPAA